MKLKSSLLHGRAWALAMSGACLLALATAAQAQTMAQPNQSGSQASPLGSTGHPPPPRGLAPGGMAAPIDPAAQNQADDPAKVAAAREFVIAYHPRMDPLNMASRIDKAMPGLIARAKAQDPKLDVKAFAQKRREELVAQAAHILDTQSHVVSRHFSMQELKDLTAFFRGPLGRKLNDESPKISLEVMQASRTMMRIGPGQMKMKMEPAQPANGSATPKK